jgi:hypothetical protein
LIFDLAFFLSTFPLHHPSPDLSTSAGTYLRTISWFCRYIIETLNSSRLPKGKINTNTEMAVPTPPVSSTSLDSMPAEILEEIFWYSRELSLINVCRQFRRQLPPFCDLARSFAILAFCEVDQSRQVRYGDVDFFPGPITRAFLNRYRLRAPWQERIPTPLTLAQRAQLQYNVLSSG